MHSTAKGFIRCNCNLHVSTFTITCDDTYRGILVQFRIRLVLKEIELIWPAWNFYGPGRELLANWKSRHLLRRYFKLPFPPMHLCIVQYGDYSALPSNSSAIIGLKNHKKDPQKKTGNLTNGQNSVNISRNQPKLIKTKKNKK